MPASRRDELIDAAMRVFSRSGFHGTCISKVLEAGSLSRMTLYNHFKSKDELIVAALRRQDEIYRNGLMKYVETRASDPAARLLAVFDFHEEHFEDDDFCGCMFISASEEYADPESPIRRIAAEHKSEVIRYLREQCELADLPDPQSLAEQLCMLLDGAIVMAHVVGQVGANGATPGDAARRAKEAAARLIEAARAG